jgi:hypothetical protein
MTGAAGSILDDILAAFKHAVDCGSCHALLVPLKALAELGDSAFVDTIVTLCKTVKVRSYTLVMLVFVFYRDQSSKMTMSAKASWPNKDQLWHRTFGRYHRLGKLLPWSVVSYSASVRRPPSIRTLYPFPLLRQPTRKSGLPPGKLLSRSCISAMYILIDNMW